MGADKKVSGLAAAAAEPTNGKTDPDLVVLTSGVELRVRRVASSVFADMLAELEPPSPPLVWIAEKGRQEENPDDPDFLEAKMAHQSRIAKVMSDAVIILGTELVSVPKGFPGPKDENWNARMRALGRRFESEADQYLAWVKYEAGAADTDFNTIWEAVGRQASVVEKDAGAAARRFPGRARRRRSG